MANSQDRTVSLRSDHWSCSELAKGASLCASMAGLGLKVDPTKLSKDDLKLAIKDRLVDADVFKLLCTKSFIQNHMSQILPGFFVSGGESATAESRG